MLHFFKLFSIALAFGLALLPGAHPAASRPAPPAMPASLAAERAGAGAMKLDGQTVPRWTAAEAAAEAELAAEKAREAAAAAAAAAAAQQAAAVVSYHPAFTAGPGAAAVKQMIVQDFSPMGQSAVDWGLRVAACESGYNPNSYNPDGASGVFQFMPGTFRNTPYGNQNIFDASANVAAAAWYYGRYGGGAWSCK